MSLSPLISSTTVPFSPNFALNNSWITVNNDQNIPLHAQLHYNVNSLGLNNFTVITGTSPVYGNFRGIQIIANTQFTALTASGTVTSISNIQTPTFPANFTLNGNFAGVQLASGSAIAYNA